MVFPIFHLIILALACLATWSYPIAFSTRGFTDTHGNSYTVDSNGTQTRMHQDKGMLYTEHSFKDGSRKRLISDPKGNTWTETREINGKISKSKEQI